ncbi:MAG: ROK family protein [Reichenbachiella sp.]|uniref:ROK family protein n=1 Tax=Reichenbachiella sp. TaxID=2184521 RepID=UPI003266E5A0
MAFWGIDLGGTKIEGVVINSISEPNVLCRERIAAEADQGYQHVLDRIQLLISEMSEKTGQEPKKLGIGTPGTLDPLTHKLKNCNSTNLNGKPFKDDLEKKLGIPVVFSNDANCFALAETKLGVVKRVMPDAKVVFGVIMGSGVGGGLVVNGQVINGRQGIAGEWGHNFLDETGGPCYCGKVGCVETILSGKSLERFYYENFGERKKLQHIYSEYLTGNSQNGKATIDRLMHYFGLGLSTVINILDPDVVVLGGGVSNIDRLYTVGVEEVKKHLFNNNPDLLILKPELGDSAGVFGAAMLATN